ncbi:MAG: IS630 family transposase [Sphingomonadaceae bacterium]
MYTNPRQWTDIRARIASGEATIRGTSRETGICRNTIKKMVMFAYPQPYRRKHPRSSKLDPFKTTIQQILTERDEYSLSPRPSAWSIHQRLQREHGYEGGYTIVKEHMRSVVAADKSVWGVVHKLVSSLDEARGIELLQTLSNANPPIVNEKKMLGLYRAASRLLPEPKPGPRELRIAADREWMLAVLHKDTGGALLGRQLADFADTQKLIDRLYEGRLSDRKRAMVILSKRHGVSGPTIRCFLGICKGTYLRYLNLYRDGGTVKLFQPKTRSNRKFDNENLKQAVFRVLHEPPSQYGINRTSWIMRDLSRVLGEVGQPACRDVIRRITRDAGYQWRKARIQLTSKDPAYRDKLAAVQNILSNLQPDEAFFSIDEFGPFAVKMKQGLKLDAPGSHRVIPQWQKSKGCMIMTAALELASNQVTHFYSDRKNTTEMIRMMDLLVEQYANRRTLYLSWDAASWHVSKKLRQHIEDHNATAELERKPRVETAPLPAGAQFLNVIESIFSGMSRAVIHNSDYATADAARAAIDRYFSERNLQFREHPKRAGKRIWGEERVPAIFSDSNNCKDPRWR